MNIHFKTRQAAISHLTTNGWRKLKSGRWLSRDESCAAHILRAFGSVVLVQFWQLEA